MLKLHQASWSLFQGGTFANRHHEGHRTRGARKNGERSVLGQERFAMLTQGSAAGKVARLTSHGRKKLGHLAARLES